jgi:4-hydroxy-2-oxoglutarate aldolase
VEMSRERLRGVFAPVVTPFENDEIRFDWLEQNLARLAETPLAGYLALGTNGEFKSLTETENLQIVERFVRMKGDKVLMVGTGCESTRETIELTRRVAELGADFASIITPHYFASRMDDDALIGYYQEIADRSPVPVLLYNIPKLANGVTISARAAGVLASHPNIWGMKDSGGASVFAFLAALAGREFSVLAGSANYYLPALFLGAEGGIISLANCFPEVCCQLHAEATSGSADNARRLHLRILQANRAVSGKYGVAGVKAAMQLAGYQGGDPRRPLQPLSDEIRQTMRSKLQELGLLG